MKILAVDTSCDETAAAVTEGTKILSNVIWSQVSLHAEFGGVMPSVAQRAHEERIDWVLDQAIKKSGSREKDLGAIAVTAGPGLAIALGVGIEKAKLLAGKLNLPLIAVNHIEGHVLSPLARTDKAVDLSFPAMGLVVSGGHTELILINSIGEYEIVAATRDDALGEALDKAARMVGLGYPGGAVLEKLARAGNSKRYPLPLPMARREEQNAFSYSGLKTAFYRLVEEIKAKDKGLDKQQIYDLAAAFQNRAFEHLTRVTKSVIKNSPIVKDLLVGGGVAANVELRKRLRQMGKEVGIKIRFPYSRKLYGDNAAMIGVAASFGKPTEIDKVDREPRARVDKKWKWETV